MTENTCPSGGIELALGLQTAPAEESMIEIKVQCDCGQRYKFDVEPVNGQMPFTVKCPVCGVDGTDKANVLIQQRMAAEVSVSPSSPEPVAQPAAPAAAVPVAARLTLKRAAARVETAPAPTAPPFEPSRRHLGGMPKSEAEAAHEGSFALSLGGVVLGAVLGIIVWHLVYRFTGWKLGFMALITGCLAGVAPQLLGHYRSKLMGAIAALVTLLAIFAAQYLNAKVQFDQFIDETESEAYQSEVDYAKRAVQAIPNGNEKELRDFLAKEQSDENDVVKPEEVEGEEIAELREQLPRLRDLASGKIAKADYGKGLRKGSDELEATGILRIYFLIRALGIFNLVNIVLGVGAAYATAKG